MVWTKLHKSNIIFCIHFQEKLKKVPGFKPSQCNTCIKKDCAKVVDTIDIEDMGDKVWCILFHSTSAVDMCFTEYIDT